MASIVAELFPLVHVSVRIDNDVDGKIPILSMMSVKNDELNTIFNVVRISDNGSEGDNDTVYCGAVSSSCTVPQYIVTSSSRTVTTSFSNCALTCTLDLVVLSLQCKGTACEIVISAVATEEA
jgi:hypothetical protein